LRIQTTWNFKNIWRDLVDGSLLPRGLYLEHYDTAQNSSHTSLLKRGVTYCLSVHKIVSALDGVTYVIAESTAQLVKVFVLDNNELTGTRYNVTFKRSCKNLNKLF
jgi:hypothetical protein